MQAIAYELHAFVGEDGAAEISQSEHYTNAVGYALEMVSRKRSQSFSQSTHLHLANDVDKLARVDAERTGSSAEPISGTEVLADALEGFLQVGELRFLLVQRPLTCRNSGFETGNLALDDDTLTRRKGTGDIAFGKAAAGAVHLAETAFDTAIHERMNGRQRFDMLDIRSFIFVENHTRIEDILGVEKRFRFLHQLICFIAPFATHKGRHIAARTMFGFERTMIFIHYQIHHLVHHPIVLIDSGLRVESLVENEVVITLKRMTINHRLGIVMVDEELLQIGSRIRQMFDGESNVFDQARAANRTGAAHRGEDARSHRPIARFFGSSLERKRAIRIAVEDIKRLTSSGDIRHFLLQFFSRRSLHAHQLSSRIGR